MKIYKAKTTWVDSFPELLSMWEEKGWVEIVQTENRCTWAVNEGDILLYEHDRLNNLPMDWRFGLFANEVHHGDKSTPWIYWARHPRNMEMIINEEGILNHDQKDIESIFLGKIENPIQHKKRTVYDWSSCVEEFSMPIELGVPGKHPYGPMKYLRRIRRAKFGLCLSGHGPKCQREIELMGVGTVPIFTKGVDNQYWQPLIEGVHFLYAETPEQALDIIKSCSKEKWKEMQAACVEWYIRNCSREGSLETTQLIIMRYLNENDRSSEISFQNEES
jgi:hypothetical protein